MNRIIYEGDWSFPVRKEFILNPEISMGGKCLYLALKSYCAPQQSVAFPSTLTLAKALGVSRMSIWRFAKELESLKLLSRSQEHAEGGRWTHTLWKIYGSNQHEHVSTLEHT
jgi:hypothetical protein